MVDNKKVYYCDVSISQADYEITDSKIFVYNVPITGEIVQFYSTDNFEGNMFKPIDELRKFNVENLPITFLHPDQHLMDISTKQVGELSQGFLRKPSLSRKSNFSDKKIYADMVVNKGTPEAQYLQDNLEAGRPVDVSIGFGCELKFEDGVYNGKEYQAIQTDFTSDHLAILIGRDGDILPGRAGTSQGYGIGLDHKDFKMADSNQKLMDSVANRNEELVKENTKLSDSISKLETKLADAEKLNKKLADAEEKLKEMDSLKKELQTFQDAEEEVLTKMKDSLKKKYPKMEALFDCANKETIKAQYKDMKEEEEKDPKKNASFADTSNSKGKLSDMDLFEIQTGKKKLEDIKQ